MIELANLIRDSKTKYHSKLVLVLVLLPPVLVQVPKYTGHF